MRENKFRGQTVDTKEWVYGWLVIDNIGTNYIITNFGCCITACTDCGMPSVDYYEVIPETVGQYTGLKEIYEGDILDLTYFLTKNKGIVKFGKYKQCDMSNDYECGNQGFYIDVQNDKYDTYRHDIYFYAKKSTVVGNVHDNPELLQGVE